MQKFIILSAVCFMLCTSFRLTQWSTQCSFSHDCTTTAPCCRDANGNALPGVGFEYPGNQLSGTCSSTLGEQGASCSSSCGCKSGLTCYVPTSGGCCPPAKCYDSVWVEQQQL
ncbi:Hypothetical predicted protein [Mytilus galloprovincialis]|uniref:Uncharacterized protein n=1 Tax=Mytilus galloprovincialis TaxID=29158 RepID=A0A8B6FGN3_MYTGA|nr:Hypothetical predicted protein [Mytilus galloprovincialis]